MANSVRQNILTKLGTCLPYITTTNGYHNTVSSDKIYKGYKTIQGTNDFPVLFYGLGSEKLQLESEDGNELIQKCEAYIGVYFSSNTLTDDYEKWIRDLKRFVGGDRKMTNNKWFLINEVSYIQGMKLDSIEPYLDYDKNIGSVLITFTIDYSENLRNGI